MFEFTITCSTEVCAWEMERRIRGADGNFCFGGLQTGRAGGLGLSSSIRFD